MLRLFIQGGYMSFLRRNHGEICAGVVKNYIEEIEFDLRNKKITSNNLADILNKIHHSIALIRNNNLKIKLTHPLYRFITSICHLQTAEQLPPNPFSYICKTLILELQEQRDPEVGSQQEKIISIFNLILENFPDYEKGREYFQRYLDTKRGLDADADNGLDDKQMAYVREVPINSQNFDKHYSVAGNPATFKFANSRSKASDLISGNAHVRRQRVDREGSLAQLGDGIGARSRKKFG
jgi:hypothetical protein